MTSGHLQLHPPQFYRPPSSGPSECRALLVVGALRAAGGTSEKRSLLPTGWALTESR